MERNQSLIFLKTVASSAPTLFSCDNSNITNPYNNVNIFNSYFASIAETTKNNIKYIHINIYQTILRKNLIVQYF